MIFEETLNRNLDYIIGQNSIILRARVSLLLCYYLDMLFIDHPDSFTKLVDYLFSSLTLTGSEHAIAL